MAEKDTFSLFFVSDVAHDRVTFRGATPITTTGINNLSDVTGDYPGAWNNATLCFSVRGYGYPDGTQDTRRVDFADGDLVHGVWLHAGKVTRRGLIPSPATFLSLVSSKTYVAQVVVGELRKRNGEVVTDGGGGGTVSPINGSKPKPASRRPLVPVSGRDREGELGPDAGPIPADGHLSGPRVARHRRPPADRTPR